LNDLYHYKFIETRLYTYIVIISNINSHIKNIYLILNYYSFLFISIYFFFYVFVIGSISSIYLDLCYILCALSQFHKDYLLRSIILILLWMECKGYVLTILEAIDESRVSSEIAWSKCSHISIQPREFHLNYLYIIWTIILIFQCLILLKVINWKLINMLYHIERDSVIDIDLSLWLMISYCLYLMVFCSFSSESISIYVNPLSLIDYGFLWFATNPLNIYSSRFFNLLFIVELIQLMICFLNLYSN